MPDLKLLDNRPLARAAIWFLFDAIVVLAIFCGLVLHPELIPEEFHHPAIHMAGIVLLTALFVLLSTISSVLGFLANCRPGRTTGWLACFALFGGLALIITLLLRH